MKFYASARLGEKQATTPEGYLICSDVRIARTGAMIYGRGEIPIDAGPDGKIVVERTADEVFNPKTVASFQGKSVTILHPDEDVSPENWKTHEVGTIFNPRRGDGIEDDFLVADLLIKEPDAIQKVRDKKLREVSCGYDADYEQVAPGRAFQHNIYGNHVALVEHGRAGPRCAIGDQDMTTAANPTKPSFLDKLAISCGFKDAAEFEAKVAGDPAAQPTAKTVDAATLDSAVAAAVSAAMKPVTDMLALQGKALLTLAARTGDASEEMTDEEKAEKAKKDKADKETKDAATTLESDFTTFAARAEILAPGYKAPTHDTADAAGSHAKLHRAKCDVLRTAYATADGKGAIDPFLSGAAADFEKLPASTVDAAFIGASELVKAKNNGTLAALASAGGGGNTTKDKNPLGKTPADLNKQATDFWKTRQPAIN